jgi:hypothetical protein
MAPKTGKKLKITNSLVPCVCGTRWTVTGGPSHSDPDNAKVAAVNSTIITRNIHTTSFSKMEDTIE